MNWISYLQEHLQKHGKPLPVYDMIKHEISSNTNVFTIRVTCGTLTADGTALNKKAAKSQAAENMVKMMKIQDFSINFPSKNNSSSHNHTSNQSLSSISNSLNSTPTKNSSNSSVNNDFVDLSFLDSPKPSTSNDITVNSVGKLQELCVHYNFSIPEYFSDSSYTGSEQKMICKLKDMSEEAIGRNKKIAKQVCAEKMWYRLSKMLECAEEGKNSNLNGLNSIDITSQLENLKIENTDSTASIEKAKMIYAELKKDETLKDPNNILIKDYHSYLKLSLSPDKLKQINDCLNELSLDSCKDYERLSSTFNKICEILAVSSKEMDIKTKTENMHAVSFRINTTPVCTMIGLGKNHQSARFNAIESMIQTISKLLR